MSKPVTVPYLWDPPQETMPRAEMARLQSARLVQVVERTRERVPFYRQRLEQAGVASGSIGSIADLPRLPFTEKADLRAQYPHGLLATPQGQVVRAHASSGTSGQPTLVSYTRGDLTLWADLIARALASSGAASSSL